MSGTHSTHSQAFRTQSSSKVISIPTRHDPKTSQRVIRWKDILQCFENAKYVMNGGETVLFLTDDDLEDLLPLRIPHHPGVVLEVVMPDIDQGDSLLVVSPPLKNEGGQLQIVAPSRMSGSTERDVITTRIIGDVDSQALVRRTEDPLELALQVIPTPSIGHTKLGTESNVSQQEQLHQLQQQMQQLRNQYEQLQHQMEQTLHIRKQMQDQMDEISQNVEKANRGMHHSQLQVQDTRQEYEQLMQEINEVKQTVQEQDHLTPDQIRQVTREAMDHFALVQYRIQDILNRSYQRASIPRLFILLPEPTGTVDGQERPCSLQFRLYFLCECGAHTMPKDFNEPHEVHLAEYHGYKLDKQDEFIRKYGRYILAMLYMAKYGAKTEGLVVPTLLGLHHAILPDDDKERLRFFKNISRLIDDTITYLEESFGAIGSDTNTAAHQKLGSKQLAQVRRYLMIEGEDEGDEEDEDALVGDLGRTMTQDGRCVWVCSKHMREYHDSTMERLEDVITTDGGKYQRRERDVSIVINSNRLGKQFYAEVAKESETNVLWRFLI
ncbi:hypothetical protein BGX34_009362 [Mortierella sp. NVP85]|nr:hypothetical protein BGX34_009362 [Mortierella sp. NVP85]